MSSISAASNPLSMRNSRVSPDLIFNSPPRDASTAHSASRRSDVGVDFMGSRARAPSTSSKVVDVVARGDAADPYLSPPTSRSPVFRSPNKNVHSDMYDTAFALQSLGDSDPRSAAGYLSRVRGLWDERMAQGAGGCNVNTNNCCDDPDYLESVRTVDLDSDAGDRANRARRSMLRPQVPPPNPPHATPVPTNAGIAVQSPEAGARSGGRKPNSWRLMCEIATRKRHENLQQRRASDVAVATDPRDDRKAVAAVASGDVKKKRASFGGEKLKKSLGARFSRRSHGFDLIPEVKKRAATRVEAARQRKEKRQSGAGVAATRSPRRKSKGSRTSFEGSVTIGDVQIPAGYPR